MCRRREGSGRRAGARRVSGSSGRSPRSRRVPGAAAGFPAPCSLRQLHLARSALPGRRLWLAAGSPALETTALRPQGKADPPRLPPSLPSPGDTNPGQGSGEGKLSSSPAAARTTSSARLSRPSLLRSKAGREKPFSGKGTRS